MDEWMVWQESISTSTWFDIMGKEEDDEEPGESHDGQTNKRVTKPEKNTRPQRGETFGTPWTSKKHFTTVLSTVLSGFLFLTF